MAGNIWGVVKAALDGAYLDFVKVSFGPYTTYTNSSGLYKLYVPTGYSGMITFYKFPYETHKNFYTMGPELPDIRLDVFMNVVGGVILDHTMCKGILSSEPVNRTTEFQAGTEPVYQWTKFGDLKYGGIVEWKFYKDGSFYDNVSGTIEDPPPGNYWIYYRKWVFYNSLPEGNYSVDVYFRGSYRFTDYFTVIAPPPPPEGHIHGIVKDAISGNPIIAATVKFGSFSTITGLVGNYDLVITEGYSGIITFSLPLEYETYSEMITAGPGDDITLNVNMNPIYGLVNGTVKDASTGMALSNVKISFAGKVTYTDTNGYYNLVITAGYSGEITFELDDYETYSEMITAGPGIDVTLNVDLVASGVPPPPTGIKETINWEAVVEEGEHTFYLLSLYGTDTDGTIQGFNVQTGNYITITTPTMTRLPGDEITTTGVSQYDCLTMIVENYDPQIGLSSIAGVYRYKIEKAIDWWN